MDKDGEPPKYLRKKFLEKIKFVTGVRVLVKIRCGNMEEDKYWLEKKERACLFCGNDRDRINHFVKECRVAKEWFRELGDIEDQRIKRL